MKRLITLDEVNKAIAQLKASNKPTTVAAIYAALGSRGSMSTIRNFRDTALGKGSEVPSDSPEALTLNKQFYTVAYDAGTKAIQAKLDEVDGLLKIRDNEIEGAQIAKDSAETRVREIEASRESMLKELSSSRQETSEARAVTTAAAQQLLAAQAAHANELASLHKRIEALTAELRIAEKSTHSIELELAKAQGKLEKVTK